MLLMSSTTATNKHTLKKLQHVIHEHVLFDWFSRRCLNLVRFNKFKLIDELLCRSMYYGKSTLECIIFLCVSILYRSVIFIWSSYLLHISIAFNVEFQHKFTEILWSLLNECAKRNNRDLGLFDFIQSINFVFFNAIDMKCYLIISNNIVKIWNSWVENTNKKRLVYLIDTRANKRMKNHIPYICITSCQRSSFGLNCDMCLHRLGHTYINRSGGGGIPYL